MTLTCWCCHAVMLCTVLTDDWRSCVWSVCTVALHCISLRMVAADRRTHSPNRLVLSEGWRPPGAHSAFIKWTGWTLAMTMSWWQHHEHCRGYYYYYCNTATKSREQLTYSRPQPEVYFGSFCHPFGLYTSLPPFLSLTPSFLASKWPLKSS